ncbi:Protein CDV3 like protein [Myotis davidii]|uniref:Protein CDV3 like protein n=1 Tax=Myotis davidii TaxID=225400 RepID=L5LD14_MYODS|nr:Protein CDV3 like protein [Myotis davidii]
MAATKMATTKMATTMMATTRWPGAQWRQGRAATPRGEAGGFTALHGTEEAGLVGGGESELGWLRRPGARRLEHREPEGYATEGPQTGWRRCDHGSDGGVEEWSLDNFFPKRDKKKEQSTWQRAGSGAGARAGRVMAPPRAGRGGEVGGRRGCKGASTKAVLMDENEWKESEQEEVDYRGLGVQAVQISEKEEDREKREDPGYNWEEGGGGGGSGVEKSPGPWNKTARVQARPASVIVTETPKPTMTSGVYQPTGATETPTRKTPQELLEIYSYT